MIIISVSHVYAAFCVKYIAVAYTYKVSRVCTHPLSGKYIHVFFCVPD